jgi:glutathione synthase/RimK-type ligase-like ATP-grasp enzyme
MIVSPIKVLCITEPSTHPENDATVHFYRELAHRPTFRAFHTSPAEILGGDSPLVTELSGPLPYLEFLTLNEQLTSSLPIDFFDVVIDRADKPLPPDYYRRLSELEGRTQFINRPSAVEYAGSKGALLEFAAGHTVDSLFTRDIAHTASFLQQHGTVVIKQNYNQGGKGVFKVWQQEGRTFVDHVDSGTTSYDSIEAAIEAVFQSDTDAFLICRFVKNIEAGDKRVIVLDGEVVGAYLRRSLRPGGWLHNTSSGGQPTQTEVSPQEIDIINQTYPKLRARGLFFVGYDFLSDGERGTVLSEINCANLGGLNLARDLGYPHIFDVLFEWLARHVSAAALFHRKTIGKSTLSL